MSRDFKAEITAAVKEAYATTFDRAHARKIAGLTREAFVSGQMTLDQISATIREAKGKACAFCGFAAIGYFRLRPDSPDAENCHVCETCHKTYSHNTKAEFVAL